MSKILAVALCERVIIDHNTGQASLINLFDKFEIAIDGPSVPETLVVLGGWAIFTLWDNEPEEIGNTYLQRISVLVPDSEPVLSPVVKFAAGERISRVVVSLSDFPAGKPGLYFFEVQIRPEDAPDDDWKTVARHPLTVVHKTTTVVEPETTLPAS